MKNEKKTERTLSYYKSKCVHTKKNNNIYYPKGLPKVRNKLGEHLTLLFAILIFAYSVCGENCYNSILTYNYGLNIMFIMEYVHRAILMIEERSYLNTRYGDSYTRMLKNSLYIPPRAYVVLIPSVVLTLCNAQHFNQWSEISMKPVQILYFGSIFLLYKWLNMDTSILHHSLRITANTGIDYGSGMAYSYYHGYLKLILPRTGTESKDFKELMEIYESKENIEFAAYKMFVLIPKSLTCLVSLDEMKNIETAKSLLEKRITVAGVQDRVYKNPVYKIKSEKLFYVVAEYATPIKTFNDVVKQAGLHTEYYEELKNDILLQFYVTLKQILETNQLSDLCELIYYEDFDESKNKLDVGKIILARLRQLHDQKKKSD